MKKWIFYIILLASTAVFTLDSCRAEAARWVWVCSTDYATVEIDASSVHKSNGGIYYWERFTYIESPQLEKIRREKQIWSNKYNHGVSYAEYTRAVFHRYAYIGTDDNRYNKWTTKIDYDKDMSILYSRTMELSKAKPNEIVPGTIGERVYAKALSVLIEKGK